MGTSGTNFAYAAIPTCLAQVGKETLVFYIVFLMQELALIAEIMLTPVDRSSKTQECLAT